jgi:hypothetical protein
MAAKSPIYPERIRRIKGSFSWIEHRFLHGGFLEALSAEELLLYYFLVTVGDRKGVSYYGYERICSLLKMSVDDYLKARSSLTLRQLIAFQSTVFQVLPLPQQCLPLEASHQNKITFQPFARCKAPQAQEIALQSAGADSEPRSVAEILKQLGEKL